MSVCLTSAGLDLTELLVSCTVTQTNVPSDTNTDTNIEKKTGTNKDRNTYTDTNTDGNTNSREHCSLRSCWFLALARTNVPSWGRRAWGGGGENQMFIQIDDPYQATVHSNY